ncbi:tetratricopeptide repeat-containing sulfotransferase family protein [Sphingomonas sp. PR090111-T3T-6A]|uniref:tetratricopeptide repeat-containing sulfotransferase family protein n=1 Tax=Sphingomonas sp. PR090111-T3T-6A TaxID=685778 RepID=UPI0003619453|nr:tetratricopeptide repeat-containing sulfotransferase family protein [Sphingomonas sp. PR090111-T3T-6A]
MVTASEPRGTLDVALAHARRLLTRDPMLAEEQAREILRAAPGHAQGLLLLGQALAATGRRADAIRTLREAAGRDPESADIWRALGDQLLFSGDGAGADAAYAHQIRASVNDPELRRAAIALAENDLSVAERILKPWLAEHPTDVAAIRMLAELAGRIGRNADAEKLLRRAIELSPSFAPARYNLATVLHRQNRPLDALAELDRLLADEPDNAAYTNLKGAVLSRIGDHDQAIGQFEAVLRQRPDTAVVWMSYGHALKTVGRQEDSVAAYRRSIDLRAGLGEAWWSLANLKTVRFTAGDISRMEAALEGEIGTEDRFHLHFALGKAFEDAAAWEASFRHYAEGNRLRRQVIDHDADETSDLVSRSASLFTPAFFEARKGQGAEAADPIFVLGMPRSGSTLVEQILASHPLVEGTRELPDILALAHRLSGRKARSDPSRYPEVLAELDAAQLRALGEEYLEGARIHRKTDRPYFIDKMPNNWAHVGLIHLILPNAKIIDTRRHPLGCCFSNFKQHFARGQAFSYALDEMGRYYADYVAAMAHVDAVLPGRVHRVLHEAMVADTEAEIRALLDHVGLPFDPACLRFWETERAVQTASSEQVRRPIFREGVEQWRHFEPWLGPLKAALGGLDRHYPALSG